MAFWGVEIQSGKPHLHTDEDSMAMLHLSQATLGLGCKNGQRIVVKCKVGENPEVLLCSLRVGVNESCALDLLFDQDVTFTVAGGASVHLTGYYMPLDEPYDSEDDSEEDELEFSDDDEDFSDLEGHPTSVKIEDAAKKAILAITNGEKKRKNGDSAVKAAKGEDTVMGEESKDEKAAVEETPAKKQAVASADDGAATLTADAPTSLVPQAKKKSYLVPLEKNRVKRERQKQKRKNKKNQNRTEAPEACPKA